MQHTFSMFVGKLEGLDETKSFIDWSANGKIVDGDLTQDTFVVDDKQTSEI